MERSKRKTDKILERHKAAMNSKMEEFMKKNEARARSYEQKNSGRPSAATSTNALANKSRALVGVPASK